MLPNISGFVEKCSIQLVIRILFFFPAAKTALNAFLFSKEASQREKDLIKSLKVN